MGILTEISEDEDSNPLARIVFPDGRSVLYEADQMDMVEHANAITIHKSQGNECQVVIIPWVWAFLQDAETKYPVYRNHQSQTEGLSCRREKRRLR
mgnify:CR=1 FL=1